MQDYYVMLNFWKLEICNDKVKVWLNQGETYNKMFTKYNVIKL